MGFKTPKNLRARLVMSLWRRGQTAESGLLSLLSGAARSIFPALFLLISMAFPVVAATNTSAVSSNATSHTVNLPSGITSGDLLLIFFGDSLNGGASTTTITGWTGLAAA